VIRAVLWAECGSGVGLGHVARSAAVAAALTARGADATLFLPERAGVSLAQSEGCDARVASFDAFHDAARRSTIAAIDSYRVGAQDAAELRDAGPLLIAFDDLAVDPLPARIIVNGAPGADRLAYVRDPAVTYLIGPRFFPLRRAFRGAPPKAIAPAVRSIVVTVGGDDPHGLLLPVANIACAAFSQAHVTAIAARPGIETSIERCTVRTSPEDYAVLIRSADIVICAAGQSLIEVASTGTPAVALLTGVDQRHQHRAMVDVGACVDGGSWEQTANARSLTVTHALLTLASVDARDAMSRRARSLVDGEGATRIAAAVLDRVSASQIVS
jgi:UDP-2,4-diacetamido-2,4,6-trideoxy-beta-L-altropyranose hydrolase